LGGNLGLLWYYRYHPGRIGHGWETTHGGLAGYRRGHAGSNERSTSHGEEGQDGSEYGELAMGRFGVSATRRNSHRSTYTEVAGLYLRMGVAGLLGTYVPRVMMPPHPPAPKQ
jgi:hypothetical protein